MQITIVGGGIAGLATAIALTKWMQDTPSITVVEVRSQPSTVGGAIGLTPAAVRALDALGVLDTIKRRQFGAEIDRIELFNANTGSQLGQIDFVGADGNGVGTPPFKGLRIMRSDLSQALLEVTRSLSNVQLDYGRKTTKIVEESDSVKLTFDSGDQLSADLLIGCDGIHSMVRTLLVEPERQPTYTGIAAISGFADLNGLEVAWKDTGLSQAQRGSLMGSFYEPSRTKQYTAAILEIADVKSREGWFAKGAEQDKIKSDIQGRYESSGIPCLRPLLESTQHWTLYPVYNLGPKGRWCTKRTILLGDAAHAMPPQGESAAIALEDAITFARVMTVSDDAGLPGRFAAHERLRRPRVDKAYADATFGWETQKDSGWISFQFKCWLTWIFLWWTSASRLQRYSEDLSTANLDLSSPK